MLSFLKHKKFWLPLVILTVLALVTELVLRKGVYNPWVSPISFTGDALERVEDLNDIGRDNVDWITVGDSRIDWGINHNAVAKLRAKKQLTHKRMSFGSSNFIATQATIDWSIKNMSQLKGVMLGLDENSLASYSNFRNQYKVAWPFRDYINTSDYNPDKAGNEWQQFIYSLAWVNFFEDIKDFLKKPVNRFKQIKRQKKQKSSFIFKKHKPYNLCAHPLETLKDCIESAKTVDYTQRENYGFEVLNSICSNNNSLYRAKNNLPVAPIKQYQALVNNWTHLIKSVIAQDKEFILIMLPEHQTRQYIIKASNAGLITKEILTNLANLPGFHLIDLRNLFDEKEQCMLFSDSSHFSNAGIKLITTALIQELEKIQ